MKLSDSPPDEDVALLVDLEENYAAAWEDWDASGEREAWESASGDGLAAAAR